MLEHGGSVCSFVCIPYATFTRENNTFLGVACIRYATTFTRENNLLLGMACVSSRHRNVLKVGASGARLMHLEIRNRLLQLPQRTRSPPRPRYLA